jgi:hypothetical protein
MRFYCQPHRFYGGIDLHARSMYLCILDQDGNTDFDRNLPCDPKAFLHAIAPFRDGIVVGVECMFAWYWVADLCREQQIPFVEDRQPGDEEAGTMTEPRRPCRLASRSNRGSPGTSATKSAAKNQTLGTSIPTCTPAPEFPTSLL